MTRVPLLVGALVWAAGIPCGADDSSAGRVRALLAQDRWREALAQATDAAAGSPSDPELAAALGAALYRAGRLDEASATVAPLCELERPPARALLTLGLLRGAAGKQADGARLVERALQLEPTDRQILYWAASFAPTSAVAIARLQSYLDLSEGEDADQIEAARGSLGFYRAIGERATWVVRQRPDRLEVPLRALGGRGVVGGWVIDISLGAGAPVPVLLDSGAGGLFLVERVARKHGFAPLAAETAFGGGGDERHATQRGIVPEFAIGDLRFRDALANVSRAEAEPTGRYQGILGFDVFQGYRITLDLKRGRLILEAPRPESAGQPYWSVAGQLLVSAGPASGPAGLFLVDTGASSSLVDLTYAGSCPGATIAAPTHVRGYGGAVRDARSVRGLRLAFDGRELPAGRLGAADLSLRSRMAGVEVSGFLGLDLWKDARLVIDTVARTVRLEPAR